MYRVQERQLFNPSVPGLFHWLIFLFFNTLALRIDGCMINLICHKFLPGKLLAMKISAENENSPKPAIWRKIPIIGNLIKLSAVLLGSFLVGNLLYHAGIHREIKYFLQGRINEMHSGIITTALIEIYDQIGNEVNTYIGNDLPTLFLDIPFENVQLIQNKRDEGVNRGILLSSDEDFVSATIRYNDSSPINVKIRLKGDWSDHLTGEKWSYRIHVLDESAIEGMRRFSIQAPETRHYLYEWAYHQTLTRENVLNPQYFFVNVIVNGENKGIYAVEESFNVELMESQQRRAGVLLRYDESDLWQNWATYFSVGREELQMLAESSGYFMKTDFEAAHISGFASGSIQNDPVLLAEYRTAQSMLRGYQNGDLPAGEVFDLETLGSYLAVTELWGAGHAYAWQNLRFYYNPITNLLEPIGFDGMPMNSYYASLDLDNSLNQCILFLDADIRDAFYEAASIVFTPAYLQHEQERLSVTQNMFAAAMEKEYGIPLDLDWDRLFERVNRLQAELGTMIQADRQP